MKKKKLFSLVLATVLTAATVLPCYGASTKEKISNAQAEQAAAQSQLDSIQSRIDELNSKKGQSEEYLSELNQQLDDLQNRLQELQDQYDAKQNELVQIQADLEDAKAKEEEQYEAMKLRIQYMYENSSGNGYMAMLFSSKSISELISRAEYIQKISDFDRDLMQEYEDTVDQVKEKETQVQEEQAAIVELQQQSSDQQEAIQELYAAAYQELRTYSAELDDAKSSESALVDEINSKADAINDLIRQAKEEEIAAQKKAEEERQKQLQAASQNSTTTNGNSGNSNSSSSSNSNKGNSSSNSSSSSNKGNSSSSSSSSSGSYVSGSTVSRAYSALGKPYVWGAAGPNSFDCSGLVSFCLTGRYSHTYSSSDFVGLTKVSNPQPGDICVRVGHVGVYIGGGQMIHAPHTGDVVKISAVPSNMWYVRP